MLPISFNVKFNIHPFGIIIKDFLIRGLCHVFCDDKTVWVLERGKIWLVKKVNTQLRNQKFSSTMKFIKKNNFK
jgi:hypothetical protein